MAGRPLFAYTNRFTHQKRTGGTPVTPEFFLASYLARALKEEQPGCWDLPKPSIETLDFLGQLLQLDCKAASMRTLDALPADQNPTSAYVAFAYWIQAVASGYPFPRPESVNLEDAVMDGWEFGGTADQPLRLPNVNLRNARLNRARLEHVVLGNAQLTGLQAKNAVFRNVTAIGATARQIDFSGMRWKDGSLANSRFVDEAIDLVEAGNPQDREGEAPAEPRRSLDIVWQAARQEPCPPLDPVPLGASRGSFHESSKQSPAASALPLTESTPRCSGWDGCQLLNVDLSGADLPAHWDQVAAAIGGERFPRSAEQNSADGTLNIGHSGPVTRCVFSPDGTQVLSGSYDQTLKLWNVATGECHRTFSGHRSAVSSCVFSPDGTHVLSGSHDKTLKLWNVATGECYRTFSGHRSPVNSCVFSPDGTHVLSGSHDKTLKLWNVATGECHRTFSGHTNLVRSSVFSPDGTQVLSGSSDNTLKLWDVATGECHRTFSGHTNGVRVCRDKPVWNRE